ncbi:MAG: amidophosphoribosyltransferase [Peptococcaceae bacterium]|nr:amidophosphoribosyltransferase [Peptococcaceae bacterium]
MGFEFLEAPQKLGEACGVFGVSLRENEGAGLVYNALLALQHRGQESAGIAALVDRSIRYHKAQGLVSEVFGAEGMAALPASPMAIGHVRYSTTGGDSRENAQPMVKEYLRGRIAVAHNGNIINGGEIRDELIKRGCDFTATTDSEIIATLIAYEALSCGTIEEAVGWAAKRLRGAFSLVVLSSQNKLIALRDGWGFRPLCLGEGPLGKAVASESCALESAGFELSRDLRAGEMVVIDGGQNATSSQVLTAERQGLCIFEFVYFARPDSVIDGLSVYQARFQAGRILAREYPVDADVICGVPDSGLEAAQGYSAASGIPFVSAFLKNRYIGRSFISPTQRQREAAVRLKLNPLKVNVAGKRIVLIDDSIVRGTTSARIIKSLKEAGAREIHLRISSPPFRHTCHFGTDIDDADSLIANQLSPAALRERIGADSLGYISVEGLKEACDGCAMAFCVGCFNGEYPLAAPAGKKNQFES